MDVAALGVMVPIVAIVLGIGSGMLKMFLSHQERMVDKRLNAQSAMTDDVRQEIAALRQEMARLRDTTTQYDLSIDHTLREHEQRIGTLESRNGRPIITETEDPQTQKLGRSA